MGRVFAILKRREASPSHERHQTQDAQLVRRADHDPTAGPDNTGKLADEGTRVLEVLDDFDGNCRIHASVTEWQWSGIQICGAKVDIARQSVIFKNLMLAAGRDFVTEENPDERLLLLPGAYRVLNPYFSDRSPDALVRSDRALRHGTRLPRDLVARCDRSDATRHDARRARTQRTDVRACDRDNRRVDRKPVARR